MRSSSASARSSNSPVFADTNTESDSKAISGGLKYPGARVEEPPARWPESVLRDAGTMRGYGLDREAALIEGVVAVWQRTQALGNDTLLGPTEAAKLTGRTARGLRLLAKKGTLANHGAKGRPRYRRADLLPLIHSRTNVTENQMQPDRTAIVLSCLRRSQED
jgi:hypothetical protein